MPLAHAQVHEVLQVFFEHRRNVLFFAEAVEKVLATFAAVDRWEVITTVAAGCFATGGSAATWAAKEELRRECVAYLRRECLGDEGADPKRIILQALARHAADVGIADFASHAERCFEVLIHTAVSADGKVEGRSPLTRLGDRLARPGKAGLRAEDAIPALVDRIARELMVAAGCKDGNNKKAIKKLCALLLASVRAQLAWFRWSIGSVALEELNPEAAAWQIATRVAANDPDCEDWQRIKAWDPFRSALDTWLDSVVKGRQEPGKPRLTREGMLFKYLKELCLVDYLRVVLRECHNVAEHPEEKQFVEYRGEQCPVCGSGFFETRDRLLVRRRITRLRDAGTTQREVALYLCRKCKNFFRVSLESCPYTPPGQEEPCGGGPVVDKRGRAKCTIAFDATAFCPSPAHPHVGRQSDPAGIAALEFLDTLSVRMALEEAAKRTHKELEEKGGLALIIFLLFAVEEDLGRLLALSHPRVVPLFTDEEYCSLGETIAFDRRDWTTIMDVLRHHLPEIGKALKVTVDEAITYDNVRHLYCTQVRQRLLDNIRIILSED